MPFNRRESPEIREQGVRTLEEALFIHLTRLHSAHDTNGVLPIPGQTLPAAL